MHRALVEKVLGRKLAEDVGEIIVEREGEAQPAGPVSQPNEPQKQKASEQGFVVPRSPTRRNEWGVERVHSLAKLLSHQTRHMILLFPDLDTLRLALTSGIVPADVTLAPAAVSFDAEGKVYVEPTVALTRDGHQEPRPDRREGVEAARVRRAAGGHLLAAAPAGHARRRRRRSSPTRRRCCSNCERPRTCPRSSPKCSASATTGRASAGSPRPATATASASCSASSARRTTRSSARSTPARPGPPAPSARTSNARPRVWVEVGHTHPLAQQIRVADKQMLLVRAPREWLFLDDAPFQDVYDIMQFKLPAAPVELDRGEGAEEDDGAAEAGGRHRHRHPRTVGAPRQRRRAARRPRPRLRRPAAPAAHVRRRDRRAGHAHGRPPRAPVEAHRRRC